MASPTHGASDEKVAIPPETPPLYQAEHGGGGGVASKADVETAGHGPNELLSMDGSSMRGEDILSLQDLDPALNMKMHLVNNVSASPPAPVWFANGKGTR